MTKTCKICEKEFESEHKQTLYCSKYCQGQSKKKPRTCINCESIFMSKSKQQRFCSNECGGLYNTRDGRISLTCVKCQKTFERTKSRTRHEITYCSRNCSDADLRPNRVTSLDIKCSNCASTFSRQPNALKEKYNYCSHKCYGEHASKIGLFRGENSVLYKPEKTAEEREIGRNYADYSLWRKNVYKRDSYTCQCCFVKGVKINAHHIYNYATHKELRTLVSNGITLCLPCHKNFHKKYGKFDNNEQQLLEFIREISQYRAEPS